MAERLTLSSDASVGSSARGRWLALAAALLGWMFDGFEMGLFPLVARPALFDLMGADAASHLGTWLSMILALFLVGASAGGLIFGWLGDRVGRVRAMTWSVLTYSIFSGLCALAVEPWQLAGLRFLAAFGMGGEWSLGVALVMEVWPTRSRPVLAGIIGAAGNVGFLLVAILSLALSRFVDAVGIAFKIVLPDVWVGRLLENDAWRMLMVLSAVPALLTFFIRLFVPESERWKRAAQQSKARVSEIFGQTLRRNTALGTGLGAMVLLGIWGSVQWLPAWAHKMTSGQPGAREWVHICVASGAIVGTLAMAMLAERLDRRRSFFILSLLSLLSCAYLFRVPRVYGPHFLVACGTVGALSASFFGWLPLYLPELFPTRVRAMGQGFAYNFGRILAAGGTLVSGQLLNHFHEDYARMGSITSLVYVTGLVLIWFCPETKGKPLPD